MRTHPKQLLAKRLLPKRLLIYLAALSIVLCGSIPAHALAQGAEKEAKPASKGAAKNKEKKVEQEAADGATSESEEPKEKEAEGEAEAALDEKDKDFLAQMAAEDTQFTGDKRIKLLMYDEADVYTITTRYGYQTNIVFSPQEEIELISVGDRSMWQIIPTGNRMFIRPMDEDVITNMTVLTNKRSYQFDLKSVAADKTTGNIYVAKFVYGDQKKDLPLFAAPAYATAPVAGAPAVVQPPVVQAPPAPSNSPFGVGPSVPGTVPPQAMDAAPAAVQSSASQPPPGAWQPAPEAPPQMATATAPAPVAAEPSSLPAAAPAAASAPAGQAVYPNYSYTYAGPDEHAPLQVYDDGKFTYLKYKEIKKPLPDIFVVDRAGKESPARYNIKGDFVVVDGVAGEMALKSGSGTVHIYNEVLNPG